MTAPRCHQARVLRRGYVLLETVVAVGLLVVGLAVIGAQLQDADRAVRTMDLNIRAMMLAEQHLAEMDLGLIQLDSLDEVQEEDFGERYPDWGWRLTIQKTAVDRMFLLKLEILYLLREGDYRENAFEFDYAETLFTAYAMRATPQPVNFAQDFGLNEEEIGELGTKLGDLGIPGIEDPESFDLSILGKIDYEELLAALPVIMDALGMELSDIASTLPPGLLEQIQESGLFDQVPGGETAEEGTGDVGSGGRGQGQRSAGRP